MNQLVFKGANDQVLTNSLLVAEKFKKRHADVLRAIEDIIVLTPVNQSQRNFALSEYKDSTGKSNPMYILTKDAFSIIVMGFNGAAAIKFKWEFVDAFNIMEQTLKSYSENRTLVIEQNIKRRYLLNKELSEVNNSINLLMKRHKDIKTELKIIDDKDFAQLKLYPLHSYIELKSAEAFKHNLKISS